MGCPSISQHSHPCALTKGNFEPHIHPNSVPLKSGETGAPIENPHKHGGSAGKQRQDQIQTQNPDSLRWQ